MKRLQLPSGITHGLDFRIQDNWSAAQALAVVELIDDLHVDAPGLPWCQLSSARF
jgi:hypothetical protein